MQRREFLELLKKYREGRCTPEEAALVEHWYSAMDEADVDATPRAGARERSWSNVSAYMDRQPTVRREPLIRRRPVAIAIAAAVSLILVCTVLLMLPADSSPGFLATMRSSEKLIVNDSQEVLKVVLNDSSRVFLKPSSSLSLDEAFDGPQRAVTLDGEAFFEVTRDTLRPFLVYAGEIVTKVLGTSFTVSAYQGDDNITVAVSTGKVSVMKSEDFEPDNKLPTQTIVTPNQQAIYDRNRKAVSKTLVADPQPAIAEEAVNRLHFEEAPVTEIFRGIEEAYGVDIVFDEEIFASCILTTSLAGGHMYNKLETICDAINARFEVKNDQIVISGTGCR